MEPEEDLPSLRPGRVGRGLVLMAISVLAIAVVAITYAHPQLSAASGSRPIAPQAKAMSYQISTVDFVDPSTGWVVAELASHHFAVLHTTTSGASWSQQLSGPGGELGEYARFFDKLHGVVILLGRQAAMYQTQNRGRAWSRDALQAGGGYVLSADFIDMQHGWLLTQGETGTRGLATEALYRTADGGATWSELGDPVISNDWAYTVAFSDTKRGWLYSRSSARYAYATGDGGSTWRRVALPAPTGGWPKPEAGVSGREEFFVAARPIVGSGVVIVVIPMAPAQGRLGNGEVLVGYPPLTVRALDGGSGVSFQYRTLADAGPYTFGSIGRAYKPGGIAPMPGQVELGSVDGGASWRSISTPAPTGAVGYAAALDWWWVGAGAWATTSDGGVTWSRIQSLGVPEPVPGSLQILDAHHAWFASMTASKPLMEMTADGGREWSAISLPPITL